MGRPPKLLRRRDKRTIEQQLKGEGCDHPKRYHTIQKNGKGKEFKECDKCGAFLGFC